METYRGKFLVCFDGKSYYLIERTEQGLVRRSEMFATQRLAESYVDFESWRPRVGNGSQDSNKTIKGMMQEAMPRPPPLPEKPKGRFHKFFDEGKRQSDVWEREML